MQKEVFEKIKVALKRINFNEDTYIIFPDSDFKRYKESSIEVSHKKLFGLF